MGETSKLEVIIENLKKIKEDEEKIKGREAEFLAFLIALINSSLSDWGININPFFTIL